MNVTLKNTIYIATLAASLQLNAFAATPVAEMGGLSQQMLRSHRYDSPFHNAVDMQRRIDIDKAQARMDARLDRRGAAVNAQAEQDIRPSLELKDMNYCGDIDAPDGSLWFYSAHNTYDKVVHNNEYMQFTEYFLTSYSFDIYDSKMNLIGTVTDKYVCGEGETRVALAEIAPVVTQSFFNNDDKYEVMVGIIVNTEQHVNREYVKVYSIGGEKKDGLDVPLMTSRGVLADVLNASTDGEENFYLSFMSDGNDYEPKDEKDTLDNLAVNYWEKYLGNYTTVTTYAKAAPGTTEPVKIFEKKVRMAQLPGDMGGSPVFFSGIYGGKPRFIVNSYQEPFFNRYDSYDDETTQRDNNFLVIDVMEPDGNSLKTIQTTKVPVKLEGSGDVISSFYSLGNFKYRNDVNYTDFDSNGQAAFVITRQNYMASTDSYLESFFVHNPDGSRRMTIYEDADSHLAMSDIEGQAPQEVFSYVNYDGDYILEFVNLRTGKVELEMPVLMDTGDVDPELLSFNMDRVPCEDGYRYACELRMSALDENDNNIMRVVWFDRQGKYIRTDQMNMGQGIEYAQAYIESTALDPKFFHTDDNQEYMLLVKRNVGVDVLQEELVILQAMNRQAPEGRTLLTVLPDEDKGALANITPYSVADGDNRLVITFKKNVEGQDILAQQHYALPLDSKSGVGQIGAAGDADITAEGDMIVAAGHAIRIYNIAGALVAGGEGKVSVSGLAPGVYIARAAGSSLKFYVK